MFNSSKIHKYLSKCKIMERETNLKEVCLLVLDQYKSFIILNYLSVKVLVVIGKYCSFDNSTTSIIDQAAL